MKIKKVFKNAIEQKFAIGAFNFQNMESLQAIVMAAEKENMPVLCCVSEGAIAHMGMNFVVAMFKAAKKTATVPIFLHLDHGSSFAVCENAIKAGFDSVMIDASALPFEENIAATKKVVALAHKKGVWVEGELGRLAGIEDHVCSKENIFTDPQEAKEFVERTKVDSLAVAIGTSHGAHKFTTEPKLAINILQQIENLLPNFPLVLHGASGIDEKMVARVNQFGGQISNGKGVPPQIIRLVSTNHNICKINVDSDLRIAMTGAVREFLATNPAIFDPRKFFAHGKEAMVACAQEKMKTLKKE